MKLLAQYRRLHTLVESLGHQPGLPALAQGMHCSERNMRILLSKMQAQGWLTWTAGRGRGRHSALVWHANPDAVAFSHMAELLREGQLMARIDHPNVLKVFHAGRQDLEIFYTATTTVPTPVFDSQVAAMVMARALTGLGALAIASPLVGGALVAGVGQVQLAQMQQFNSALDARAYRLSLASDWALQVKIAVAKNVAVPSLEMEQVKKLSALTQADDEKQALAAAIASHTAPPDDHMQAVDRLAGKTWRHVVSTGATQADYQAGGFNEYTISELFKPWQRSAAMVGMRYLPPFLLHDSHSQDDAALARSGEQLLDALREPLAS